MMPFAKDPGQRENDQYCSLCFKDGALLYKGDNLQEFQQIVRESMKKQGRNPLFIALAVWSIRFAPRWKK